MYRIDDDGRVYVSGTRDQVAEINLSGSKTVVHVHRPLFLEGLREIVRWCDVSRFKETTQHFDAVQESDPGERIMLGLAFEYHRRCEAAEQTFCKERDKDGFAVPRTVEERSQMSRNARKVMADLHATMDQLRVSGQDLPHKTISEYVGRAAREFERHWRSLSAAERKSFLYSQTNDESTYRIGIDDHIGIDEASGSDQSVSKLWLPDVEEKTTDC